MKTPGNKFSNRALINSIAEGLVHPHLFGNWLKLGHFNPLLGLILILNQFLYEKYVKKLVVLCIALSIGATLVSLKDGTAQMIGIHVLIVSVITSIIVVPKAVISVLTVSRALDRKSEFMEQLLHLRIELGLSETEMSSSSFQSLALTANNILMHVGKKIADFQRNKNNKFYMHEDINHLSQESKMKDRFVSLYNLFSSFGLVSGGYEKYFPKEPSEANIC